MGQISSLAKPGPFNHDMVKLLVEFYDEVNELSGRIRVLSSSLEKFDSGADSLTNTDFYVTLDKLLEVIDRTIERGKKLRKSRPT